MFEEGLAYDDVLLVPKYSEIASRKDVSTETFFSRHIKLQIPLVSSLMDTVTESRMAILMAQLGGLGLIHRFMSTEDEVYEVLKVKRYEGLIIDEPYTIGQENTLKEAREIMKQNGVTSLLVVDSFKHLQGILTHRDYMYEKNNDLLVKDLRTERSKMTVAAVGTTFEQAKQILGQAKFEKLPLVDANNILKGLIASKDIEKQATFPVATTEGMKDLIKWGVDGVRVGIGPGGFCTTRIVAGVGVHLLTSLIECAKVAEGTGGTVIADGGTRYPGDV